MGEENTTKAAGNGAERIMLYLGLAVFVVSLVFVLYANRNSGKMKAEMEALQQAHQALAARHETLRGEKDALEARALTLETEADVQKAKLATANAWFGNLQEASKELSNLMYQYRLSLAEQAVLLGKSPAVAGDINLSRVAAEVNRFEAALDQYFSRRTEVAAVGAGKEALPDAAAAGDPGAGAVAPTPEAGSAPEAEKPAAPAEAATAPLPAGDSKPSEEAAPPPGR